MKTIDANAIFGVWPKRETDISLERLVALMQANAVSKSLALSMKGVLYDYEEGNLETLAASRQYSQIIPAATCDLRRYCGGQGFAQKVVSQGFKAIRLFPEYQNWPVAYAPFHELWDEIQSVAGLPLIITAAGVGFLTALSKLPSSGKTPVIITGVGYPLFAEAMAVMKRHPHFHLDTAYIETPDGLEILSREVGVDRLVFGSFSAMNYFRCAFGCLEKARLKDEQKALIAAGNIERILGIQA